MYLVDIWLRASPSNYWAQMEFADPDGERREKIVSHERIATINSNMLQGLIEAVKVLRIPCMLDIHTESDYIISPIRNGWVRDWKKNGWRTAHGREIKNLNQWQQLERQLARHSVKMSKMEGDRLWDM